ncbi:MAG: peptidoglycan DD-metalloendopeptidase family protein [Bacteroidales bacterium]|nr:peptidoglycan DD-metalloendopeptidase family protein [Bacteroidales bacterium]
MKKLVILLILLSIPFSIFGQDVSKQTEQRRKIEEEIAFIDNQLKNTISKQKVSIQQLTLVQKKVTNRKMILQEIDGRIKEINTKIANKNREISKLKNELDTLHVYYDRLVYSSYKNRDTKIWFMYIMGSETIGQGYRRFSYLKNLSGVVSQQAEKIRTKEEQQQQEKKELVILGENAKKIREQREKEYKTLLSEEKQSKNIINTLSRDKVQYKKELAKKKKEVEKLNKEIERILKKTVLTQNKASIDYSLAGKFEQNKGNLPWPVKEGIITEKFGTHFHPIYKNIKLPQNNGISISTTKNASVFSVFDGVVKQILVMPGYNQCVLIQHGIYFTFYCKLQKVKVKSGQKVSTGEVIGTLDESDGTSILHFQIWKGTEKQNPESWLK